MVDTFIADLKDAVREVKVLPSRNGTMVSLYGMSPFVLFVHFSYSTTLHPSASVALEHTSGLGNSSAVGPSMVGELAEAFLDTMYKA
jgi:sphinganine-1-phosphate aldolase